MRYNGIHHSSYYHRRYDGWMEQIVEDSRGKIRIKRVYTGEYYEVAISDRIRVLIRILYPVFYLIGSGCFLLSSALDKGINRILFVQFMSFTVVISLIAMFIFLLSYVTSPRRMTKWEYYAGPRRLGWMSLTVSSLLGIQALAAMVLTLLRPGLVFGEEWMIAAGYLIASASMGAIRITESRIPYFEIPNDTTLRGGYYIES